MTTARTRTALITGIGLLVGALLVGLFLMAYERVTVRTPLPPQGEASYNQFYVLGRALEADGLKVRSRARLDLDAMAPGSGDTIVMEDSSRLPPSEVDALLAWVSEGGHLLVRTPTRSSSEKIFADYGAPAPVPLLDALGVDTAGMPSRCLSWEVAGDPHHREFCKGRSFRLNEKGEAQAVLQWGNARGLGFARLRHGRGSVDVVADMDFMYGQTKETGPPSLNGRKRVQRDGLHDIAHRDLTRYLLDPNYGKGTMWLVYLRGKTDLSAQILRQAWPVLLPVLLALLAWLWARSQRFGSALPPPPEARRSLLEHVGASGQLLLRQGNASKLHTATRDLFLSRLARRAPVAAAQEGSARDHAIAALLGWPADRVATALSTPADLDHAALKVRIDLLLQMRSLL